MHFAGAVFFVGFSSRSVKDLVWGQHEPPVDNTKMTADLEA